MLLSLLSLVGLAAACADHELHSHDSHAYAHVHEKREYPQTVLTPPYRPLTWGDFNVIHTTDTHGWLLGHQKSGWAEPNYSGDLGDFASFVAHMKQIAIEKDVDLLLVDSGDLHDGTGLSDGYPPGGVDAHESNRFIERLPYDLMTIGNHELYVYADTYDMYTSFIPHLRGFYLSSNVNITVFGSDGEVTSVPVGNRSVTFTTRKGRKVTSLGVLFDFTGNDVNTTVQPVADMVQENWFKEAIADEPDVFLLIGHMPVSDAFNDWPSVFNAIRAIHPLTPIMIFGGHSHIRDCQQYDGRSMALESGRYMETIGWMSAELDASKGNADSIAFTRRYLDQNRVTYEYHTNTSNSTFDTAYGRSITAGLEQLAVNFNLSYLYGDAPQIYTLRQDPYGSAGSLWSLFIDEVAPAALKINNTRAQIPNIIVINNGPLRYDIFQGSFTKNDELTASPYTDDFSFIANVSFSVANQVIPTLNNGSASAKRKRDEVEQELWARGHVEARYRSWLGGLGGRAAISSGNITYGYNTTDSCPGAGDDTIHINLPYYDPPQYMGSNPPNVTDDTLVDLVFLTFIENNVVGVLNQLQSERTYTQEDVMVYSDILTNGMFGLYAQTNWN